jgi:hypothetical protein
MDDSRRGYGESILDLGILLSVPLFLVVIHVFVPEPVRSQLVFSHDRFSPYPLLTWVYVHPSDIHLSGSIGAYLLAGGLTYVLAARAGARRWFRYSFGAVLLLIPLLTALTRFGLVSILAPAANPVEQGFVDVAAAYGGTMLVALWAYVGDRFGRNIRWDVLITFLLFVILGVDTLYRRRFHPLLLGGLLVLGIVQTAMYVRKNDNWWRMPTYRRSFSTYILSLSVFFIYFVIVTMLYPADAQLGQQFLTTFADTLGIWYGVALGSATWVAVSSAAER